MMKVIVDELKIGDKVVWKDAVTDDLHVYDIETTGKAWGTEVSVILGVLRTVDDHTIERRNLVIESGTLVDVPEPVAG
jgi:hypothetical protein